MKQSEVIDGYLRSTFHRHTVTMAGKTAAGLDVIYLTVWVKMDDRSNLLEPFVDGFNRVEITHIRQDAPDENGELYLRANVRITL